MTGGGGKAVLGLGFEAKRSRTFGILFPALWGLGAAGFPCRPPETTTDWVYALNLQKRRALL